MLKLARSFVRRCFPLLLPFLLLGVAHAEPSEALKRAQLLIAEARQKCDTKQTSQDTLTKVICSGEIDIGVRANYRLFGEMINGERVGFELDLARQIAQLMGVQPKFLTVTGADRIAILLEGKIDVVIGTMGHTTTREAVVEFVKPHYYLSSTAIVGVRSIKVNTLSDLAATSVCVPLGSYANMLIADARARLMIYSRPDQMIDALRLGACKLIAHDDSLLTALVTGPVAPEDFREKFDQKFAFSPLPWGMGVRPADKDGLGQVLSYLIIHLHQTGFLVTSGERHGINTAFLSEQQTRWKDQQCFSDSGVPNAKCFLAPADLREAPTVIAPHVVRLQNWLVDSFAVKVALPMFTGKSSMDLLVRGAQVSVFLVLMSIVTTLAFSFGFYKLVTARNFLVRALGKVTVNLLANTPVILLLVLGYLIVTIFVSYDIWIAMIISLLIIGANNGANGGMALSEAAESLPAASMTKVVVWTAGNQLRASVINAVKATPVAAFIGVPEMLSALNDISSFTGERLTTYALVALYYLVLVQIVIVLSAQVVKWGDAKK